MQPNNVDPYLQATHFVPPGETRTFAELAALAGRPGAARAAGRAVAACPIDADHPWHRIVTSQGALSPHPRRAKVQRERLIAEGAIAAESAKAIPRATRTPKEVAVHPPSPRKLLPSAPSGEGLQSRLSVLDWEQAVETLDADGIFVWRGLLVPEECQALAATFTEDEHFERTIGMGPRGYGVGTYRYFREPIPEPARSLRTEIYHRLRGPAGRVPGAREYPDRIEGFWDACRESGQERASSILLRYPEGGVNFPHRDIYGRVWFPYQATCVLSRRGADFDGGEFLLHETVPGEAPRERLFALDAGDVAIFASRGYSRREGGSTRFVELRHGMRAVTRGERFALGLVLHLAE